MANDHTIKTFSAADIEKYHRGLLSSKEMHEMEKAALEDPFLADAMEGYTVAGVNVDADIVELRKRLAEKKLEAKVIPIGTAEKNSIPWLRVAAMVIVLIGAGFLVYQFGFNKTTSEIAQSPVADKKKAEKADTTISSNAVSTDTDRNAAASTATDQVKSKSDPEYKAAEEKNKEAETKSTASSELVVNDDLPKTLPPPVKADQNAATPKPAFTEGSVAAKKQDLQEKAEQKQFLKEQVAKSRSKDAEADKFAEGVLKDNSAGYYNNTVANIDNARKNQALAQRNNVFRGKVTDAQNNALPFANITNPVDNVGTYADANGNFVLTSPDTVLNVQVRSIGFENNTVQLRNYARDNQVLMQEDQSLNARVLDTTKHIANRSRLDNMKFEEPEPADGWINYDAYVANNLKVPETYQPKLNNSPQVELSFEVNKYGQPVNIKVVKSLCETCDKEAIRLIKEGPRWKRAGNKRKTTVTVAF